MKNATENRIGIKDIALRAGVSTGTVDRVLHNRGEVAVETRNHILSIVDELGYTPNILAKSLASKKLYNIVALIPASGDDNPYWEKPRFGIEQAYSEIKDFNTKVTILTFDLNNPKSQLDAFQKIIRIEPDGFIFAPQVYQLSLDIVRECEERRIPYIFIDVNLEGCNNLAYFGQNAEQSGFLAAKLMYYSLQDNSIVLVIKPVSEEGVAHHLRLREKGFLSYFLSEANKKRVLTTSLEIKITRDDYMQKLETTFKNNSAIKGIFVTNSRVYKVAQFLYNRKIRDITLIGYDLITKNLDFLERGVINFLIGQKPEEQGYKSVLALFNYLLSGKHTNRVNFSPIDIIMKENIDYYKNFKF